MNYVEISILIIAGFLSSAIKNGVGIGSGIFLLPVLALQFPAKMALALGAPIMFASDLVGLRNYWREWVSWREIAYILVPAIPGLIIGTLLIPQISGATFRICVGVFGVLYALMLLFPNFRFFVAIKSLFPKITEQNTTKCAAFYGFFGGVATILAHAGGIVWSMYLMISVTNKRTFVATIVLLFCITNSFKILSYMYIGILNIEMCFIALCTFPAIYFGSYVGNTLNKKINQHVFRRIVLVAILIISCGLIFEQ